MLSSHFLYKLQRNLPVLLLVGILVFSGTALLYAAAPNGGYTPGATLDPDCAPGDVDCIVNPGVGGAVPTNGLQVVGGGIGLGGELTEAVTIIDGEVPGGHSLAFGLVNPFDEFYLGAETININSNSFVVDSAEQVEISGQTASTSGAGDFRIGEIDLSGLFGASFPGIASTYTFEHSVSGDVYTLGNFHVEADDFGGIPVSQHFLVNNVTGDSGFLRFVDSGGINIALTVDNGTATGLSVNENGAGFVINDVNTFNIPTTAGTNGYVLATDGNGNTSWVAGGSGAVSIENSNSIFSTGVTGWVSPDADNAVFLGYRSGNNADEADNSNFIGLAAGESATNASYSNFIGVNAGFGAVNASYSNFFGTEAGNQSVGASYSNFLGFKAGSAAVNAANSNFLGSYAGRDADNASSSNFIGTGAGDVAANASNSEFIGASAGNSATNASFSQFIGQGAGSGATNAEQSIFIGSLAGNSDTVNNTGCGGFGCSSILIGKSTSTGGFSNSIAIGAYATNTATNQFMIGSTNSPISEMNIILDNLGGECVIDITGANCSSDESLKKDITSIDNALDIIAQLDGVTYHWVNGKEGVEKTPGFIAQDVKDILPEAVRYNKTTGRYMMNYTQVIPYLVEAIKALNIAVATGTQAGAQVGELVVTTLRAQRVETEMLCIGSICITEKDLAGTGVGEKPDREDATQRPLPEDKPTESSDSTTGGVPKETAPTTTEPTESTESVVTDPNTVTTETPKEKPTSGEFDTSAVTIDATEPKPADNEVGETGEPDSVIGEAEPKL